MNHLLCFVSVLVLVLTACDSTHIHESGSSARVEDDVSLTVVDLCRDFCDRIDEEGMALLTCRNGTLCAVTSMLESHGDVICNESMTAYFIRDIGPSCAPWFFFDPCPLWREPFRTDCIGD